MIMFLRGEEIEGFRRWKKIKLERKREIVSFLVDIKTDDFMLIIYNYLA